MLRPSAVLALAPLLACGTPGPYTATSEGESSSSGSSSGTDSGTGAPAQYEATIRRTSYGVAHVSADDLGSLLFGQAFAFAQDHVCTLADQIVKVRSERSLYFGPGDGDAHLTSDFAYLALDVVGRAQRMWDASPDDIKTAIEGYAAGYNQYVRDTSASELPDDCAGAPWVKEISALDLVTYYVDMGLLGSSNQLVGYIGTAQPPTALQLPGGPASGLGTLTSGGFGSNGWAVGAEKTKSGGGIVVANPHFPWTGELKLWESHLTLADEFNIYGVGLMGVPGVLIGFNEHVAWTHTFSSGVRFTFYKLDLDPDDPTAYMYDGTSRPMTKKTFEVAVKGGGKVSRTLYYSHYGPMLNLDPFGWSPTLGITYRDANIENPRLIEQFLGMDRAGSLDEFKQVYATVQGIPWVNTMAADAAGNTWYADASATANISQEAIEGWQAALEDDFLTNALYQQGGLVVLNGSDSKNEWITAKEPARAEGLVPFAGVPKLDRRDFVFNANDSYWLANPAEPLEGFSPLHGSERAPQSPRTRMNALLLQSGSDYPVAGDDGLFTLDEVKGAIQGNHSLTAGLVLDVVLQRCQDNPIVQVEIEKVTETVDLHMICDLLGKWDRKFDPDSVGAFLFREFLLGFSYEAIEDRGSLFDVPFDPDDPIATPHTVTTPAEGQADTVLVALAKAVHNINKAGVPMSAPLKQLQRAPRGDREISVHGGFAKEGIANVVGYNSGLNSTLLPKVSRGPLLSDTGLTERGYVVNYGSSFVMAVELGPEGPKGEAFLTYSQSEDPRSPHFYDQTELFSRKEWRPLLFRDEDIAADPNLHVMIVRSRE